MKQYYKKQDTPLIFHNFLRFIILPILIYLFISFLVRNFPFPPYFDWFSKSLYFYYIIVSALLLLCFIGFFTWKAYAYYSFWILLILSWFKLLYVHIVIEITYPDAFGNHPGPYMMDLIYFSLLAIPIAIYYFKRRFLFSLKRKHSALLDDSSDNGNQMNPNE